MNLPGVPLQNCLDLYDRVTSTTPGMCRGGVCTRMACGVINCRRTKKKNNQVKLHTDGGAVDLQPYSVSNMSNPGPGTRGGQSKTLFLKNVGLYFHKFTFFTFFFLWWICNFSSQQHSFNSFVFFCFFFLLITSNVFRLFPHEFKTLFSLVQNWNFFWPNYNFIFIHFSLLTVSVFFYVVLNLPKCSERDRNVQLYF